MIRLLSMNSSTSQRPAVEWKPLVICPSAAIGTRLMAPLREIFGPKLMLLSEYPRMGSAAALAAGKGMNLCFLDAVTNPEHAQVLIAELAPAMPVVALLARNDADLILRCLRRGASEFLTDPGTDALRDIVNRLSPVRSAASPGATGAIWCVVSGKPGCGGSTVALHLASQARRSARKVLLVDTDGLSASASFQLKLKPEFHLGDLLRDWKRMDEDLWNRLVLPAAGIDVLAAPEDPSLRFEIQPQIATELAAFWRARYPIVIVDFADARAAAETGLAAVADLVMVTTTNELCALHSTRRSLQCLDRSLGDRRRVRLLLNRYSAANVIRRDDISRALSMEPFAFLTEDAETLRAAMIEGRPATAGSRFGTGIESLFRALRDQPDEPKKGASWLGSLLARK